MILVSGASSAVGRELVRLLIHQGEPVRAFLRDPAKLEAELPSGCEVMGGDFSEPAGLRAALDGVRLFYLTSFDHPETVAWQSNALDAAKAAGVERLVRLSAPAADPNSPVNFARWHGVMEQRADACGIPCAHLRPNWYMDNFLEEYLANGVLRLAAGRAPISLIDARDIAAAAARTLLEPGHGGRVYDLTGPAAITHDDVADALARATGKPFRYEDVNLGVAAREAIEQGVPAWRIEMDVDLGQRLIDGENSPVSDDLPTLAGRRALSIDDHAAHWAEAYARLA
jgi:uncharacterized protein YbjT (DUF2867 family)